MDKKTFMEHMLAGEGTLYRTACALLSSEEDRRDALQETALLAWQRRDTLREEKFFTTWVTRILINVCHGMYRRQKRWVLTEQVEPGKYVPTMDAELRMTLETLPEKLRLPLWLFYLEGFSIAELAQTLGVPEGTVKYRLHQARKALKVELTEESEVRHA